MKFIVLKTDIERLIKNAYRFASNRSQLPILENVVIRANKTKVFALSTNLEISFFGSIGAKVVEAGEIAIPANILMELTNKINSEKIEFEAEADIVKITGGGFKGNVSGMNTSDFPMIAEELTQNKFNLNLSEFCDALNSILFSVSRDDTRPVLTGVLMYFDSSYLYMVSSDGFRLSQNKMGFNGKGVVSDNLIIPKPIFSEIIKMKDESEEIGISYEKEASQVVFKIGENVISSRLIEGNFPDFNKIIPKQTKTTIELSNLDFKEGVGMAGIFARDSANVIKLDVNKDGVKIISESAKSGSQESVIEAKVTGVDQLISFNYRYIEEVLGVCKGEGVIVKLVDSTSPGVFTDIKNPNYMHIIMPVRMED